MNREEMMRKLTSGILAVGLFLAVGFTSANAQDVTDEDVATTIDVLANDGGLFDGGIVVTIDTNPTNGILFTVDSDHDGSLALNTVIPEPASMLLFGSGLFGLVGAHIRKRKNA